MGNYVAHTEPSESVVCFGYERNALSWRDGDAFCLGLNCEK